MVKYPGPAEKNRDALLKELERYLAAGGADAKVPPVVEQVHRLMEGLDDHPDFLAANLPADASKKIRVPVIINCFPYSAPGRVKGVHLYDYSALSRFFESGEIKLKAAAHRKIVEEYSTGIRLWAGDQPTPEDLLAQLEQPSQFNNVLDSLAHDDRGFPMPPDCWVFGVSFIRKPVAGLEAFLPDAVDAPRQNSTT